MHLILDSLHACIINIFELYAENQTKNNPTFIHRKSGCTVRWQCGLVVLCLFDVEVLNQLLSLVVFMWAFS